MAPKSRSKTRPLQAEVMRPVLPALKRAGWVSVLAGALWLVQAGLVAWAVGGWIHDGPLSNSIIAAIGFACVAMIRAGLDHRAGGVLFDAADRVMADARAEIIARDALAPGQGSASVAALVVQKIPMIQPWIMRYFVAMRRVMILPILFIVVAATMSWAVALIFLMTGPLIPVFMALVGMAAEDASRKQMREITSLNDLLMDRVMALLDIRLLGATPAATADFETRAEGLRARTMAVLRIAFLSSTVLELFSAIGVALVAVFVGFSLLGEISFGSWGAQLTLYEGLFLLLIAPEFYQPLRDLAAAWHDKAAGAAVLEDIDALRTAPRISALGSGGAAEPLDAIAPIMLRDAQVVFDGDPVDLPDLDIAAGEGVALLGASGSGKSTLLRVLLGLQPLSRGTLSVAGTAITGDTADQWRAGLALIPQAPHFGAGSLGAYLDPRGTGADPWAALQLAHVDEVVRALPHGLETVLGESGGGVSGGEARRLMIARAIMMDGQVVLADEPTADLDQETADKVIDTLVQLHAQGRTLIVATHDLRLAAAMARVIEVGAP